MRLIPARKVIDAVAAAVGDANYVLEDDVRTALRAARDTEESPVARDALDQIIRNAAIASEGRYPVCQDTGLIVAFVRHGEAVRVEGGLNAAITAGVRQGTEAHYLRRTVCDAFTRANTGDGAPPVIHAELVPGDGLTLDVLPKGGGCENMSRAAVLTPGAGADGVVAFVVDAVREGGVNACPPLTIGVGIGGDLEMAALLAKKSLIRPLGEPAAEPRLADLERRLLESINALGIGAAGLGGRVTALAVHAAMMPCHIASLPVAAVLQCHAHRHRRIEL
jgi:fumarate hydratase subunit alpha